MALQDNSGAKRQGLMERMKESFSRLAEIDVEFLPVIGKLPAELRYARLVQILLVSALLASISIGYYVTQVSKPSRNAELAATLQTHSQRTVLAANRALRGEVSAFSVLHAAGRGFADALDQFASSNPVGEIRPELDALRNRWEITQRNVGVILAQRQTISAVAKGVEQYIVRHVELMDLAGQITSRMATEAPATRMAIDQLAFIFQRLSGNVQSVMSVSDIDAELATLISEDIALSKRVLDGLMAGDAQMGIARARSADIREKLFRIRSALLDAENHANLVASKVPQLREVHRASAEISSESEQVFGIASNLSEAYTPQGSQISLYAAMIFALVALGCLVLLGLVNIAESRRRADVSRLHAEEMALETRRNQDAILRLLNEMGELAEGNLSTRASVTEDITGAIADAVNFAIEELRTLVENVNSAAAQVTDATEVAKQISVEMLASADRQSHEVAKTTESINHMSQSIARVSKHAAESAGVAQQSLASAKRGGDAVRNAIAGMETIRDQIQETSKRIKRLGESSQEIGEILDLITDITEQTNVLALNAAIQAAAAGEAGRGFTVVAEEVQRLAERSGQATRRIGALVKTIQSDTQDAVHAMALSTQEVVEGTNLSDGAGLALRDIETVSEDLAGLIQNISEATTDQAKTAAQIANTMRRILAETRQTEESAQKSAQSIAELTALSDELKVSVAGFKL